MRSVIVTLLIIILCGGFFNNYFFKKPDSYYMMAQEDIAGVLERKNIGLYIKQEYTSFIINDLDIIRKIRIAVKDGVDAEDMMYGMCNMVNNAGLVDVTVVILVPYMDMNCTNTNPNL